MAFFKFRQSGENPSPPTRPAESVEVMRQRAKHRLIGAAVLVLLGVIGFPLLFDTQPRPIPVDIQIDMPDKNKLAPLQIPAMPSPASPSLPLPVAKPLPVKPAPEPMAKVSAAASLDPEEQLVGAEVAKSTSKPAAQKPEAKPVPKPEPKVDLKPEPKKPEPKPAVPTEVKSDAKGDDGARAKSLLEGKDPAKAAVEDSRYIIQVGAFADPAKAREVRLKLEKAGFKTYTHVAETKEGQRIRVRVGPFGSKAEADKVAAKVKTLSLPAAILTL